MSEVVFILGAGASRHAGAPLMLDFLDRARQLFAADPITEVGEDLKTVFSAISNLQAVHSKSQLDLVNLETVFSAFEMAELLGLAPAENSSPGKLTHAMRRLIAWTLKSSTLIQFSGGTRQRTAYQDFAQLANKLKRATVITFNYDVALDIAFSLLQIAYSYRIDDDALGISLLKLHGSVNWFRCPQCSDIVPVSLHHPRTLLPADARISWTDFSSSTQHCGVPVSMADSIIVPPTWDKSAYRSSLVRVWKRAAKELAEATNIFVSGYSLPETDAFFRYLYGLGTVGGSLLKRFWVFDPDAEVHRRFRDLLGPGAKARFRAEPINFEGAIGLLQKELLDGDRAVL